MRESVTYQAVLEEGREEGRLAERRSIVMSLLQEGMAIDLITRVTGWSVAEVTQLKQDNGL
jgi:predicted transposase YdaD